jgi:tetratricopeptide (TPR) repeat protein
MGADSVQFSAVAVRVSPRPHSLLPAVAAGILVVAGFAALLASSRSYVWSGPAEEEPYNLIVAGFRSGHLWLGKEAPPGLVGAANPYDFATYRQYLAAPWSLTDLSYFRGHIYAYFGATPALILFWPYRALTGGWLHQAFAVLVFCVLGYAVALGLGLAVWRRYFPGIGAWAGAAIALLLGSATTLPVFLVRPGLYEVSISCGFSLAMLSLAALWNAWHRPAGKRAWLAAASAAYGMAVGARPSLLFGALILFLPACAALVFRVRRGTARPWLGSFLAALLPISAIGACLAAYNAARFGDPLQFGNAYQLTGISFSWTQSFDARFFWYDVRLLFTAPLRWHAEFPFVWEPAAGTPPPGHLPVEFVFGSLTNLPVLLAALVPLAWVGRRAGTAEAGPPTGIAGVLAVLFLAAAVPICFYAATSSRYLLDFMPALALLALTGTLALWGMSAGAAHCRAFGEPSPAAAPGSRLAPLIRGAVICAFVYSVAVAWLLAVALGSFYRGAERGIAIMASGRIDDGIAHYERLCRINPDFRGRADLMIGTTLLARGRQSEGIGFLESAVAREPDLATAHFNLGQAYLERGRFADSAGSFRRAAALDPFDGEAQADLGVALFRLGLVSEAIEHERAALRIEPSMEAAKRNLAAFLASGNGAGRR